MTFRVARLAFSRPRTCSQPESTASATTILRSYPTGGTRVSCLKKPTPPYFAPICSTTTVTSSPSHTVASSSVSAVRLLRFRPSPLANYVPYTHNTGRILEGLASLKPKTLATMHGSSFCGDCQEALLDLATVMKEVLDKPSYNFAEVQQAVGP